MRARILRRVVQGLFLVFFVFLFARAAFPLRSPIPVDLLLRLDPLTAAISFLAGRAVVSRMLLAITLLGVTFLLGRVFCGYVCPLGSLIDLTDRPLSASRFSSLKLKAIPRNIKYFLLIFLLFLGLFGRSLIWPFDPLVIFTRSLVALFHPAAVFLGNQALDLIRPLAESREWDTLADAGFTQPLFRLWLPPAILLTIILGLGLMGRRFWCRALCPLGALLALVTRLSPLRRLVFRRLAPGIDCRHCEFCSDACPMGAIEEDENTFAPEECIGCGLCIAACPWENISIRPGRSGHLESTGEKRIDWDRRRVVLAGVLGLAALALSRFLPRGAAASQRRIRPPGAVPEAVFLSRCLRCGECMKVCITNGLQPAVGETGSMSLWTPVLVPRKGPCERQCNLCGRVCPTQAIRALDLEEKSYARIGRAAVDRSRCLEWGFGKACLVCDEVCPYGAIFVEKGLQGGESRRGPVVDTDNCIGCGVCELHCPVPREAAIRVSSTGEDRLLEGSFITPEKRRSRQRTLSGEIQDVVER